MAIKVTHYNYATRTSEVVAEGIDPRDLANCLTAEELTDILEHLVNSAGFTRGKGKQVGRIMQEWHRALQHAIVLFILGILEGLTDGNTYTDARNAWAIKAARAMAQTAHDTKE